MNDRRRSLPLPASENRRQALFTPDVSLYEKSTARWRLPTSVQGASHAPHPHPEMAPRRAPLILGVLVGLSFTRRRPDRMWLVPLTLLIGAYPQLLVLWDVDGLEPDRHALGAMVEIRIAMIIALVLSLSVLLPGWLAGARVQARDGAGASATVPVPPAAPGSGAGRHPTRG